MLTSLVTTLILLIATVTPSTTATLCDSLHTSCTNLTLNSCVTKTDCFWCLDDDSCRSIHNQYCKLPITLLTTNYSERFYDLAYILFRFLVILIVSGCWVPLLMMGFL